MAGLIHVRHLYFHNIPQHFNTIDHNIKVLLYLWKYRMYQNVLLLL